MQGSVSPWCPPVARARKLLQSLGSEVHVACDVEPHHGVLKNLMFETGRQKDLAQIRPNRPFENLCQTPLEQSAILPTEATGSLPGLGRPPFGYQREALFGLAPSHDLLGFKHGSRIGECEQGQQHPGLIGGAGPQDRDHFRILPIEGINLLGDPLPQRVRVNPFREIQGNEELIRAPECFAIASHSRLFRRHR